ncbi:uncharacterized protein TNCV_2380501 [Trichonephila clavipes]|nr:uncharacterized protein TNCV_2380501 [Trichonephila clavipes]
MLPVQYAVMLSNLSRCERRPYVTNLYGTFPLIFLGVFLGNINSRLFPINSKKKFGIFKLDKVFLSRGLRDSKRDDGRLLSQQRLKQNQKNSKDLIKPRVIRITVINQGSQPIAGPSHQQDSRQDKSPTVASRHEGSGQYNKARETKTTKNGTNRAAERRTVQSNQMTAGRPCPYYLRSRVRQPEGFPEERRNSGLASIPQNNIRRSLGMEALDGDPVDRSE